jgi:Restriction endonuclease BglII
MISLSFTPAMDYEIRDFRHASRLLQGRSAWNELEGVVANISQADILAAHQRLNEPRRLRGARLIAGGQSAINLVFREKLAAIPRWTPEPALFDSPAESLRGWKMDFLKESIGVEVSFNHAEAIPWTFTRLNIAGESEEVIPEHRVEVGVAVFAQQSLKTWARMDQAVGTFERAWDWLRIMRPIMPVPILVVGLGAERWESGPFRGTARGTRTRPT